MSEPTTTKPAVPRFYKWLQIIGIIGLTLLVANFIYQVWQRHIHNDAALKNTCNIKTEVCSKVLANGASLELSLNPRPLKAEQNINIQVTLTGIQPDTVELLLFALPASLSKSIPVPLTLQANNTYVGQTTIPSTNTKGQRWVAMVMVKNGNEQIGAPFPFTLP